MSALTCPDALAIAAFASGSLTPERAGEVAAHLRDCDPCRGRASTFERGRDDRGVTTEPVTSIGRYEVVRLVGSGGMGRVYLARDPGLERNVALKLLRADVPVRVRHMLRREAKLMARVSHPNVVPVFDIGTWAGGDFLAMEFVEGVTLRQWLRERAPTPREAVRLFREAGAGLAAVHEAGLVHRDFKPQNVLVGNDGRPRVTDFGLARLAPPGSASAAPPTVGASGGTPGYMAPEQWVGEPADAKGDQFSFCVALYEALYGQRPFGASTEVGPGAAATLGWSLQFPASPRVRGAVRRALAKGLALAPEGRHPSMTALLGALEEGPARRRWVLSGAAAVAAVGLAAGLALTRSRSCDPASFAFDDVWSGARRDAVQAAFLRTGLPYAEDSWRGLERALDRYVSAWVASRAALCLAERQGGEGPRAELARRASCLDRRRLEFDVLTDELVRADAQVLGRSLSVLGALGPVEACAGAGEGLDEASEGRPAFEPIYRDLAFARASTQMGRYEASGAAAARARERARGIGRPALEAEALLAQGEADALLGRRAEAEEAMREAYVLAEGARRAGQGDGGSGPDLAFELHGAALGRELFLVAPGLDRSRAARRRPVARGAFAEREGGDACVPGRARPGRCAPRALGRGARTGEGERRRDCGGEGEPCPRHARARALSAGS